MKTRKPIKPGVKNLALKRIGKIAKVMKMLKRVKGLDLTVLDNALTNLSEQLEELAAGGSTPSNDHADLL